MLNSARNRLALIYLATIMVLSVGFSFVFYHQSAKDVRNGLKQQSTQLRPNLYFTLPDQVNNINLDRQRVFNNALRQRLVMLNLGMLAVGAVASYYLADRALKPLKESVEAQERFTSDAAHELRTPLTAMKTEIEVVLRSGKLTADEAKELLASNLEEINKLDGLTGALLRLAKNQDQPLASLPVIKLKPSLDAAVQRVFELAAKKQIEIKLPGKLSHEIRGDADQLTELFTVLLDNAVKYSPDKTKINVTATKTANEVKVSIADQGIGIAPGDLPHIFERFYRVDSSRNASLHTGGYGLGLSLAESIVKAHGGHIQVASSTDKGTTFTLLFPVA